MEISFRVPQQNKLPITYKSSGWVFVFRFKRYFSVVNRRILAYQLLYYHAFLRYRSVRLTGYHRPSFCDENGKENSVFIKNKVGYGSLADTSWEICRILA